MQTDLLYANRTLGEGTKVKMAMYGLRAFNQLIAISNQETETPAGVAKKQKMIQDFKDDSNLRSGISGTRVNPIFGLGMSHDIVKDLDIDNPLWNITTPENSDMLLGMCQNAGKLFDRAIDFERQIVDEPRQEKVDQIQLGTLSNISAETIVFMFQTFKQFKDLPENMQDIIKSHFIDNIVNHQGWSPVPTYDDDGNLAVVQDLIKTAIEDHYNKANYALTEEAVSTNMLSNAQKIGVSTHK